jgi:hypothetical protein
MKALTQEESLYIAEIILSSVLAIELFFGFACMIQFFRNRKTNENENFQFSLLRFLKNNGFGSVTQRSLVFLFFVNWIFAVTETSVNLSRKLVISDSLLNCQIASVFKLLSYALSKICNFLFLACRAALVYSAIESEVNWKVEAALKLSVVSGIIYTLVIVPFVPSNVYVDNGFCVGISSNFNKVITFFPAYDLMIHCFLMYMFLKPLLKSISDRLKQIYKSALFLGVVVIILSQLCQFVFIWVGILTKVQFVFGSFTSIELFINFVYQMVSLRKVFKICVQEHEKQNNLVRIYNENDDLKTVFLENVN